MTLATIGQSIHWWSQFMNDFNVGQGKGFRFDLTINAPTLLMVLGAALSTYSVLDRRVTVMETKQAAQESRDAAQDASLREKVSEVRELLREIREDVKRLNGERR